MVSRRSRSLFAVLLAFAMLPIVSMAAAGATEARAHAAMAWMQWQAKSQTAAHTARAGLGEMSQHHFVDTPFLPPASFQLALRTPFDTQTLGTPETASSVAPARLHSARAPPTLS